MTCTMMSYSNLQLRLHRVFFVQANAERIMIL
jgi:hypothetical protein